LISVSEDGTIAVTNLNSGEIHKAIHNYKGRAGSESSFVESNRVDMFFDERKKGLMEGKRRRNSFSNDISVSHYYQLVRVKSLRIFSYASFSSIDKIVEVKSLNAI